MKQVMIPTNKGMRVVQTGDIIRVQASSSYSKIYFSNQYPLTVAKVLHWFEGVLPQEFFCRIHRTHIVNRRFITEISAGSRLLLANGEQLQVSKRKKQQFKELMQ